MDIISHGFWSVAAGKFAEKKIGQKLSALKLVWWGIFPDLFAFTVPFIWFGVGIVTGEISFRQIPRPQEGEPPVFAEGLKIYQLASSLYNVSHSLFLFVASLLLAWWILRRMPWEMFGWLLHILIDIPTHSFKFFPTPLFWPLSGWKFTHGFSWGEPWFIALDISALIIVYIILYKQGKIFQKKINLEEKI